MDVLKPRGPLLMTGDMGENWQRFNQLLELQFTVTQPHDKPLSKAARTAVLLSLAGEDALEVFNNFSFSESEEDYETVVDTITCIPLHRVVCVTPAAVGKELILADMLSRAAAVIPDQDDADADADVQIYANAGRLHERTAHHIFVQLASAVAYLHRHNIAHRDLKCENVLLTTQLVVKLADFSFSRGHSPLRKGRGPLLETYCGSEAYAPPEVLQGIPYQPKKADMWSLGVVLYVMMTAALPFEDGNIVRQVRLQMNRVIRFPRYLDSTHEYRNLVRLLLEPVTTLRATMGMVVKHPWLLLYPDPTNT
ncbi:testis-specific serine/threonine-protein kinase 3-like [Dermacentor variabilis]|uniref:testis-specific serine/threonine-protein kinase 3-like n=1 Tax=Dermacentor variabilis TaxID=34621 RepID=UPI003F5B98DB